MLCLQLRSSDLAEKLEKPHSGSAVGTLLSVPLFVVKLPVHEPCKLSQKCTFNNCVASSKRRVEIMH
jgi:hypothetical protein